jgi:hypothetical protein
MGTSNANVPPLGFIRKRDRTNEQHDAHARFEAKMPKFAMGPGAVRTLNPGEKIILQNVWNDPNVVADLGGLRFNRFHQLTGSCVGASMGNALVTLSGIQRALASPTKAMLPFWPYDYGLTRYNEGDRGQGEGAMNSSACDTMKADGVLDYLTTTGLPQFDMSDGFTLTSRIEMQWSDGAASVVTSQETAAKVHPLGTAAPCSNSADALTGIINGYPFYYGVDDYVGNGSISGSGANAYVRGKFDGVGGHSTCLLAAWAHPTDGLLFGYQNNWAGDTYPTDPAGLPTCAVWIPQSEVDKIWSRLEGDAYLLSHLTTFPAQPGVLDWIV